MRLGLLAAGVVGGVVHQDRAGFERTLAAEDFDQILLAVAGDAGDADDFMRVDRDRIDRQALAAAILGGAQAGHRQADFVGRGALAFRVFRRVRFADHHRRQVGRAQILHRAGAGHAAAAQHRDLIDEGGDFLQFVGDDHDGQRAGVGEVADQTEHLGGFLGGQDGGRFVQHQEFSLQIKLFDDLGFLPFAGGEVADLDFQRHLERHAFHELLQAGDFLAPVDHGRNVLARHHQVFGDGHRRYQGEVLVHHAEAERIGVGGTLDRGFASVDDETTFVGAVVAQQAFYQCRFAGAVFTEQAVHAAGGDLQRDVGQGVKGAEMLADADRLDTDGLGPDSWSWQSRQEGLRCR